MNHFKNHILSLILAVLFLLGAGAISFYAIFRGTPAFAEAIINPRTAPEAVAAAEPADNPDDPSGCFLAGADSVFKAGSFFFFWAGSFEAASAFCTSNAGLRFLGTRGRRSMALRFSSWFRSIANCCSVSLPPIFFSSDTDTIMLPPKLENQSYNNA